MSYSTLNDKTRSKVNAKRQVEKINRGQQGEDTNWKDAESGNRHERRRFKKASRIYDKEHGDGAAAEALRRAVEADKKEGIDPGVAARFVDRR